MLSPHFLVEGRDRLTVIRLQSEDGTNRLSRACILALTTAFEGLSAVPHPLIITGNQKFLSAGAELSEIAALTAPAAYDFARIGQQLMNTIENFPTPILAGLPSPSQRTKGPSWSPSKGAARLRHLSHGALGALSPADPAILPMQGTEPDT